MEERKMQRRAVALKYEPDLDRAPRVVAAGRGEAARRIIEIAEENHIHIQRDPDLVEVLSKLEIDREIPPELYAAVAELLAFVYSLNGKKIPHSSSSCSWKDKNDAFAESRHPVEKRDPEACK
jgi:flagellar biosynthesis protein